MVGQTFPKHAVDTSVYALLRHPWLRKVLERSAQPHHPTVEWLSFQLQGRCEQVGMAFRNRAEPWMAEPEPHMDVLRRVPESHPHLLACTKAW